MGISTRIPAGYKAVPVDRGGDEAVAHLCLLAATQPAPGSDPFVLLRSTADALYYLGCLTDRAGRWLDWVEIAVQHVDGLQSTPTAFREMLSNHVLDTRWLQRANLLRELQPDEVILCGHEVEPPPAFFYDPATGRMATLEDQRGVWRLCRDDQALLQAGLPAYTSSLSRYLVPSGSGMHDGFLPLTKSSIINENTLDLGETFPAATTLRPFNPACGLMEARRLNPLSYEDYADLLSGHGWRGLRSQGRPLEMNETWPALSELAAAPPAQQTFFGGEALSARLAEVFYLKLNLFVQAVRLARHITRRTQLPFLNLSGDSFRLRFDAPFGALPLFWTARASLSLPGQAVALRARDAGQRFFIRLGGPANSIYLPPKVNQIASGTGEVRLRGVATEQERTVVRGTLALRQPLNVSATDILWLRLTTASGSFDFFGHLFPEEALSRLDIPFRTWPLALEEEDRDTLKTASEQFALPPAPFEVIPMLSAPVDLYSLAILAVRTFLTAEEVAFQDAVDDMLTLAREMAGRHQSMVPLPQRLQALMNEGGAWLNHFGPQHLVRHPLTPEEALAVVPPELWFNLLATLITLFPAVGPDSLCQEFGTVPPAGLESLFDEPLLKLENLLLAARARIVPAPAGPATP